MSILFGGHIWMDGLRIVFIFPLFSSLCLFLLVLLISGYSCFFVSVPLILFLFHHFINFYYPCVVVLDVFFRLFLPHQ